MYDPTEVFEMYQALFNGNLDTSTYMNGKIKGWFLDSYYDEERKAYMLKRLNEGA